MYYSCWSRHYASVLICSLIRSVTNVIMLLTLAINRSYPSARSKVDNLPILGNKIFNLKLISN